MVIASMSLNLPRPVLQLGREAFFDGLDLLLTETILGLVF